MGKSKKRKTKTFYLGGGSEQSWEWQLQIVLSANQQEWLGNFTLSDKPRKRKNIYLAGGSQEGWSWQLELNVTTEGYISVKSFYVADELRKYRQYRRNSDYRWAERTFHQPWLQQFEIHHFWNGGEVCYFLTPEEHLEQDRILREHGLC